MPFGITNCIPGYISAPWDSGPSIGSQGCGSPHNEALTQAPPTLRLPWSSPRPLGGGRRNRFSYSMRGGIWQASLVCGFKRLLRHTCVLEDTQFLALATGQPLALDPGLSWSCSAPLQNNYFLLQAPNGVSNSSILIYSLNRCK
jgi:hypothetical protein